MAYQLVNASNQYFSVGALNVSVPPVTFSMWINLASVVAGKHTALFIWRGSINTGVFLLNIGSTWELRYFVANGTEWQTSTGLIATAAAWQHVCVAITSTQARLYLNGASYTNNTTHGTANINAAGELANDSSDPTYFTSFNGLVAEAAIWSAALSHEECLALSKGIAPLALSNRLHDLVLHKDLIRDLNRGIGPALTAVNTPAVAAHPLLIYPSASRRFRSPVVSGATPVPPYRVRSAVVEAGRTAAGWAALSGAALGVVQPSGEVSA